MQIQSEQLAYWYFRLNGFLNIPNFVVHPDTGNDQRTDVDLLGVRFPYRAELLLSPVPMRDDDIFRHPRDKAHLILAEVKVGLCNLNGPWTKPGNENMQRVLRAVGILPLQEIELAAAALYEKGVYSNQLYKVSLFCLGARKNPEIADNYPKVIQLTWEDCLTFIDGRFRQYRGKKAGHNQWDKHGKALWNCSRDSSTVEEFIAQVEVIG